MLAGHRLGYGSQFGAMLDPNPDLDVALADRGRPSVAGWAYRAGTLHPFRTKSALARFLSISRRTLNSYLERGVLFLAGTSFGIGRPPAFPPCPPLAPPSPEDPRGSRPLNSPLLSPAHITQASRIGTERTLHELFSS
jgi:hypothetical protein